MTIRRHGALILVMGLLGCTTPPQSAPVRVEVGPPLAWGAGTAVPIRRSNSGFYQVKAADTLWAVAMVHDVDVEELARWNGIRDPDVIVVGQQLHVAPPDGQSPPPPAAIVAEATPVAPVEENIQGLGAPAVHKGFSSWTDIKEAPKSGDEGVAGRPLLAPVGVESVSLAASDLPSTPPTPQPLARPVKESQVSSVESAKGSDVAKSADYIGILKAPSPKGWQWPVKGKVVQKFGQFGQQRYNGIDIAVAEGTPVAVTAPGIVAYADDGLSSYGNLILVRHGGSYMSAYAHNSAILVKPGQKLSAGDIIARAGSTGSATKTMLHFELRKGITPIDPMPYLPKL